MKVFSFLLLFEFYRVSGSIAIADVPVGELVGLNPTCPHGIAVFFIRLLLAKDVLHHLLHRRGGVGSGDKDAVALNVFHVRKIGWICGKVNRLGAVPRPSH